MLKIVENKNELILRDYPVTLVISGALMVAMGLLLVLVTFDLFYPSVAAGDFDFAVTVILLSVAVTIVWGIYTVVKSPVITTVINSRTESLSIKQRCLLNEKTRDFKFSEVERRLTVKTYSNEGASYHTPQLKLKTGETIDLISTGLVKRGKSYDIADLVNKYLSKDSDRDTFKLTILNDD